MIRLKHQKYIQMKQIKSTSMNLIITSFVHVNYIEACINVSIEERSFKYMVITIENLNKQQKEYIK